MEEEEEVEEEEVEEDYYYCDYLNGERTFDNCWIPRERQTDTQTDRQTETETERQRQRQTDRQRQRDRENCSLTSTEVSRPIRDGDEWYKVERRGFPVEH